MVRVKKEDKIRQESAEALVDMGIELVILQVVAITARSTKLLVEGKDEEARALIKQFKKDTGYEPDEWAKRQIKELLLAVVQ